MSENALVDEILQALSEYKIEVAGGVSRELSLHDLSFDMLQMLIEDTNSKFLEKLSADALDYFMILINKHNIPHA